MKMLLKVLVSIGYYVLQCFCVVACSGESPESLPFGPAVALVAFVVGLGTTFTVAALGPIFNFTWIITLGKDLDP